MKHQVLLVEDDDALRAALTASLQVNGFDITASDSGESALKILKQGFYPDIIVSDIQMAGVSGIELLRQLRSENNFVPVILMTAYGEVSSAVEAMRLGACDYLQKPFEASQLTKIIADYLPVNDARSIVYADAASKSLFNYAKKIAATDSSVLLSGPSGAGKEVMARFIHDNSARRDGPFVAINCAAIPENMLEATLFGYEKGAFTGAHQSSPGKFEQAQGGTLLLDEISEMALGLQAKLLRVIQEKEVERIGGKKTIALDVRIIATTNRDLKKEVSENRFREDLYYRLNVFPIQCLALKDRPADIMPLAEMFLQKYALGNNPSVMKFSPAAKVKLEAYHWPGNVRELDNLMQRVAVFAQGNEVRPEDIIFEQEQVVATANKQVNDEVQPTSETRLGSDLRNHEYQIIIDALIRCGGKKKDAAVELGISPRTLRYKLAKMREQGYAIPSKGELK